MKLPGNSGPDQLFIIGDVHGRDGALDRALRSIAQTPRKSENRRLVFLGDLIDRGPGSVKSLHLAQNAKHLADVDQLVCLFGNHELMLLSAIDNPEVNFRTWLGNGGTTVLTELDIHMTTPTYTAGAVRDALVDELSFIRDFQSHFAAGDLIMVHAGIDPAKSLAQNFTHPPLDHLKDVESHWAWIRSRFLYHEGCWGYDERVIIHGHTPANFGKKVRDLRVEDHDLVETHRRINLDIGANQFDQLLILEVFDGEYDFTFIPDESYDPFVDDQFGLFR